MQDDVKDAAEGAWIEKEGSKGIETDSNDGDGEELDLEGGNPAVEVRCHDCVCNLSDAPPSEFST